MKRRTIPPGNKAAKLPRGFTDPVAYRAMMQRLVRLKHRREFRYWGPGGHKRGDA